MFLLTAKTAHGGCQVSSIAILPLHSALFFLQLQCMPWRMQFLYQHNTYMIQYTSHTWLPLVTEAWWQMVST